MTPEPTLLLAVVAGLVSFLSPCVLPLIPAYVTFITGASLDELTGEEGTKSPEILRHALLFVAGFSFIFILLGGSAGFIGSFLLTFRRGFEIIGGSFLIFFGILLTELIRLPWANREWRVHLRNRPMGNVGTFGAGVAFGFGWTPCIGPLLGGILTLAAAEEDMARGMFLLSGYSVGLAVPFLLAAVGLSRFMTVRSRIAPWLPWIQRVSGAILIILGLLLVTGEFTRIAAALARMTPQFLLDWM